MKRVLVCGDAMLDLYWSGSIDRISPEAPVPVVAVSTMEMRRGGAANVESNIRAMGVKVDALYSPSFESRPVEKIRIISGDQHVCRIDFDRDQIPIEGEALSHAARDAEIVVFSDYGKGALRDLGALIWRMKREGKTVLVDPKGRRYAEYAETDVLKPNIEELRRLIGGWLCEEDLEHKVKALQRRAKIGAVLLTRGAEGMKLFASSITEIPCVADAVVDVSGAGDTAMAALAAGLARGIPIREAAVFANKAAGISVGRFGTAIVEEKEVF